MRILPAFLLLGVVGCMDSLSFDASEQNVGSESCSTIVTAVSSGATVAITIDEGFNAWKGNDPPVTLTGTSTTCTGTTQFTQSALGSWSFGPNNQQCTADYAGSADLAIAANHWHNVIHCDQSVEVVGCTGDAAYTAAVFVDGPGPNDFSTTVSGALGAVQDPDVFDTCPVDACPIGACVSACEANCAQGDTDCGTCCECWCKEEGREGGNDACQPQDLCYSGSDGHAVCLAQP
jgi:hypothetical protein